MSANPDFESVHPKTVGSISIAILTPIKMTAIRAILRGVQRLLLVSGVLLLGLYVGAAFHAAITSRVVATKFADALPVSSSTESATLPPQPTQKLDFTLWSNKRLAAYQESLLRHFPSPIALMRIRHLGLEAEIFEGVDDLTLDRGLGHIPGTALPGQNGNIGVAGHRDGFFRPLKDIAAGDEIEILTANTLHTYTVDQIFLVVPKDVSVLEQGSAQSLTLVTCYPFYFIGSAPKRYIVKALLTKSAVIRIKDKVIDEIPSTAR
jgi:sortase A